MKLLGKRSRADGSPAAPSKGRRGDRSRLLQQVPVGFGHKLDNARAELQASSAPPRMHPFTIGLTVTVLVFTVALVCEHYLFVTATSAFQDSIRGQLKRLARAAASVVDPELHKTFVSRAQEASPQYGRAIEPLRRLKASDPEISFVYTCVHREGKVFFVLDPTPQGDANDDGLEDKSHIMDEYPEASVQMKEALFSRYATAETEPAAYRSGTFVSGYAPIRDSSGKMVGIAGVDLSAANYKLRMHGIRQAYIESLAITALLALISGLVSGLMQKKSVRIHRQAESRDARYREQIASTLERVESAIKIAEVSRNRFSDLFEGIPVACVTFDRDYRVFEWNGEAARAFGLDQRSALDTNLASVLGPGLFGPSQEALIRTVLAGERFADADWSDGRRHWLFSGHPLIGPNDEITGGILAAVDISRQKDAEDKVQEQLGALNRAHSELNAANQRLKELVAQLEELAMTDMLTGLPNRRALYDVLRTAIAEAHRGHGFALVQADIDYFKNFNDVHGHHAGDEVLKLFAQALRDSVRPSDFVARHGGEEFYVLLRGATKAQAMTVTERIRTNVSSLQSDYGDITASFGMALWKPGIESDDQLMQLTDAALYEAKDRGRNCVVVSEDLPRLAA